MPWKKGYNFLVSCVQPDGRGFTAKIWNPLTHPWCSARWRCGTGNKDRAIIENARRYLITGLQVGDARLGANSPFSGGIGYGASNKRPDLSNTMMVLEALYNGRQSVQDAVGVKAPDLNWKAAIQFVQNCQNLRGTNSQAWASDDPQNKGGFIYAPERSNAGKTNLANGRVAYRSYGTMTYAGLLSYIYADIKTDDPRVTTALDWLRANYPAVEENPALGQAGDLLPLLRVDGKSPDFCGGWTCLKPGTAQG